MPARVQQVQQGIHGYAGDGRKEPDDRRNFAPLAVLGELLLEAEDQRRDPEHSGYGSQYNVEDQEYLVIRLQVIRSAP